MANHAGLRYRYLIALLALCVISTAAVAEITIDDLGERTGQQPETVVYKEVDGTALTLYVFKPAGFRAGDSRPAVVCIHGGGWRGGTPELMFPHARYFASRGAVGFSVQYRLVPRDGASPSVMDCITDCKSAMRYIRQHAAEFGIDPERMAATGDSAGGHLAACLGTVGAFNDPTEDITVSAMANATMLFNPVADLTGKWIQMFPECPDRMFLARSVSPVYHIASGQPPALLMHGADDPVVVPEQAEQYAAAMEAAGNRCDFTLLAGEKHAFVLPFYYKDGQAKEVAVGAIRAADDFLISLGYLTGAPTLVVSSAEGYEY